MVRLKVDVKNHKSLHSLQPRGWVNMQECQVHHLQYPPPGWVNMQEYRLQKPALNHPGGATCRNFECRNPQEPNNKGGSTCRNGGSTWAGMMGQHGQEYTFKFSSSLALIQR